MAELDNPPRVLYAAGYRTPNGAVHYFDGPNPSLQLLRGAVPPPVTCWYHPESDSYCIIPDNQKEAEEVASAGCDEVEVPPAYLVKLEGDTVTPVARWDGETWIRKKPK